MPVLAELNDCPGRVTVSSVLNSKATLITSLVVANGTTKAVKVKLGTASYTCNPGTTTLVVSAAPDAPIQLAYSSRL